MEIKGRLVKKIGQREGDGAHGHWIIATYLIQTEEMYPKSMAVDVMNGEFANRIGQFDSFIGKMVVVRFDIDAHEYQGKWFNSIKAFGIKDAVNETKEPASSNAPKPQQDTPADPVGTSGTQNDDDLPF